MLNSFSFNTGGDMLNAFKQFGFRQSVAVAIAAVGVACSAPGFAQGAAKAAAKGAGAAAPAEIVGNAQAGAKKNSACIGCHGIPEYRTAFPVTYRVPKIAGQSEKYLESALKAYRSGERPHPSMKGIATTLTDQDIADLSAFYAGKN